MKKSRNDGKSKEKENVKIDRFNCDSGDWNFRMNVTLK